MIPPVVETPDERIAGFVKPPLERVSQFLLAPSDWLVVCAGFEDRALGVITNAVANGNPFHVLLISYEPFLPENRLEPILEICRKAGLPVAELTYNRQEPAGFGDALLQIVAECQSRVFLDVSAMSRLLIVQSLVALKTRPKCFADCVVAYAEAETYPPSRTEAETELAKSDLDPTLSVLFLSSGVFDVAVIPELSSFSPAGLQTRLVAFPSLDTHQLTALRNELQPSRFTFIEGVPPSPENKWRQGLISAINHLDQIPNAERFQTSTLNYYETLDCLLALYARHDVRERLLVSPTGSKMQTVAVGLFRAFVEDVQIVYPIPRGFRFPTRYTLGVGALHAINLARFAGAG
jgi:hypothetical protein